MQIRPLGTDLIDGDMKNLICAFLRLLRVGLKMFDLHMEPVYRQATSHNFLIA